MSLGMLFKIKTVKALNGVTTLSGQRSQEISQCHCTGVCGHCTRLSVTVVRTVRVCSADLLAVSLPPQCRADGYLRSHCAAIGAVDRKSRRRPLAASETTEYRESVTMPLDHALH